MAQGTLESSRTATDTSLLIVPGVVLGAYLLTRLPFGFLSGMALGFAAGWAVRGTEGEAGWASRRGGQSITRGREWVAKHEPGPGGSMSTQEKVDEMVEDSFPASDPPSYTPTKAGKPRGKG
ncbi:MAG TPA: hypothetical protein VF342_17325 [Alphaproteobacteria bacterium]